MTVIEKFVAADVSQMIWLRLRRLTSSRLCKNVIGRVAKEQREKMTEEILREKSEGMSWAMKSALGYWDTRAADLNSLILARYYAVLQLTIAEQIGAPALITCSKTSSATPDTATALRHSLTKAMIFQRIST